MARLKKQYRDEQHERDKKREKIRRTVCNALAVFWVVAIFLCGIFQDNDTVVGLGLLSLGVANTAYCLFSFRVKSLGWKVMTIYDSDELQHDKFRLPQKDIEKEERSIKSGRLLLDIFIAIFAVLCFVFSIIKLI